MPGIVVGVDGSQHSHNALDWAIREARLRRAPLTVIAVLPVAAGTWGIEGGIEPLDPLDEPGRKLVQQATQETVDKALASPPGQPALDVTVRAVSGLPADELIYASADADMLVVGARGAGGFARLLMGSVSTQVTHHAQCPVVVVRADRGD
jgi:nucleotide-binding universal stress UspA family protein